MDSILIKGGARLCGSIKISGSKNATLPIIAAALLTDQEVTISNIPKLTDIYTMKHLIECHGGNIELADEGDQLSMVIDCSKVDNLTAPYEIVRKMRASIWVLGPLLARFGSAKVSLPGGCAIGARQVDMHIAALEAMGATIEIKEGYIHAKSKGRLQGVHFVFNKQSVGATINTIMAATLAKGETCLFNCNIEPEIIDLCHCLNSMGAEISGIGTSEVTIIGKEYLHGTHHAVIPDRIEAGTYMIAAAITKGEIDIYDIDYHIVENVALKLKEAGINVIDCGSFIKVQYVGKLTPVDIQTGVYPAFSTDLQAQFMSLMSICDGTSIITENIFENRFMHVPELCRMGAHIKINGHSAVIRGVKSLNSAEVMASDLRASVSLVLAGLVANGETKIRRIYHLDRGYQLLEAKLQACGADILRVKGDSV
jgi:UDP-N-acetylglucosamine 1-carboxyvinyltransferase